MDTNGNSTDVNDGFNGDSSNMMLDQDISVSESPNGVGVSNGSHYSTREVEMLRLIGQYLYDKGFKSTYQKLMADSGIELENSVASRLRQTILEGQWDSAEKAVQDLSGIGVSPGHIQEMQFLILEQRFLEYLEENQVMPAVTLLRNRITPMQLHMDRVHVLASCIMCRTESELRAQAGRWEGKSGGSRSSLLVKLQTFIPAQVMLPARRLDELIGDAVKHQMANCAFHNTHLDPDSVSLLNRHDCGQHNFPAACVQTLRPRDSELWLCQFSPNGVYLAIAGKEPNIDLWIVNGEDCTVSAVNFLPTPPQVTHLTWSPDSKKVAGCCGEEQSNVVVFEVATGRQLCSVRIHEEDTYQAAVFFNDSKRIAFGGLKGVIFIIDSENNGQILAQVEGYRVQSMACLPPNSPLSLPGHEEIIVADSLYRVRLFRFAPPTDQSSDATTAGSSVTTGTGMSSIGQSHSAASQTEPSSGTSTPTSFVPVIPSGLHPIATTMLQTFYGHNMLHAAAAAAGPFMPFTITSTGTSGGQGGVGPGTSVTIIGPPHHPAHGGGSHSDTGSGGPISLVTSSNSQSEQRHSDHPHRPDLILVEHMTLFKEQSGIHHVALSRDGRCALVAVQRMGLHLWDLQTKSIVQRFVGNKQEAYQMLATFGGLNEDYVSCGSEDGRVHIWHRSNHHPIHSSACGGGSNLPVPVTGVHWSPLHHALLASVSDDGELKIWAPKHCWKDAEANLKELAYEDF